MPFGTEAFRWTIDGAMSGLGDLPGGDFSSMAFNVSADGAVVVGVGTSANGSEAFRWSSQSGIVGLGDLPGGNFQSWAGGVSADGTVVVGESHSASGSEAFRWTLKGGMVSVRDFLIANGADNFAGWQLTRATAISEDGNSIVGTGINPAGDTEAWLARLDPNQSTIIPTTGPPPSILSDALRPINPTTAQPSGQLKRWNGQSWEAVTSWNNNGINPSQPTVVITHGWYGQITDANWTASMAEALQGRDANANILAWDWRDNAASTPGDVVESDADLDLLVKLAAEIPMKGLRGALASAQRGGTLEGVLLANELKALGISNDKLQLIGHSNGGAVVGGAAKKLSENGVDVLRITTLDAPRVRLAEIPAPVLSSPLLELTYVDATKYVEPDSASQVEAYYSGELLGRAAWGFGAPLVDQDGAPLADNVFNGRLFPGLPFPANVDHLRITDWYDGASGTPGDESEFVAAIHWAIVGGGTEQWRAGNFVEQGYNSKVFGTDTVADQFVQPVVTLINRWKENFEVGAEWLGQNAELFQTGLVGSAEGNFAARLFAGSNGYLWTDVTVPDDAYYLTFDLMVETPDIGDFLTVSLGDELVYYKSLFAADEDFSTVDPIFIGDFAGQEATLLFTLNHVGDGSPSLLLDNITFSAVPEPRSLLLFAMGCASFTLCRRRRCNRRDKTLTSGALI